MFNALVKVYDWYHENIAPSCPPSCHDDNILAPVYYGKVNISEKSNTIEVSITPQGTIGIVRKFAPGKDATIGERYILTPSCIQHRRRGASANDREYQFFNKFSVIFGENRQSWLSMMEKWIEHHVSSDP